MDLPAAAGRSAVILGVDMRHDLDGYWSDRSWLALGMGACYVRRYSPGFPVGPLHVYRDDEELCSLVTELRQDRDRRAACGAQARKWVMENHTYCHRSRELLEGV
jgi:hypothetical protein